MSFWKKYSKPVFIALFLILSILILFLDIEATPLLGLTLEEEILFPVFGILFLGIGLLYLKTKLSGSKTGLLQEFWEMGVISKIFGFLSIFLLLIPFIMGIFYDLSLFNFTPGLIIEERIIAIGMLASALIFILVYTQEIERKG